MNQANLGVRRKLVICLVQEVLECVSSRRIYLGAGAVKELLRKPAALRVVDRGALGAAAALGLEDEHAQAMRPRSLAPMLYEPIAAAADGVAVDL